MAGHLAKNPFLLLLKPRRLCTTAASSSAAAGELAPASVVNEIPHDDDLQEESRSRQVRDTCKLLELRGSWTPKLEAQLRHLLRVLSPPQVRAVLRAQAQTDARAAFEFFRWADRQWRYRHAPEVFDEMLKTNISSNEASPLGALPVFPCPFGDSNEQKRSNFKLDWVSRLK